MLFDGTPCGSVGASVNTATVPILTVALLLLLTADVFFDIGWMACREAADAIERGEHRKENEE